MSGCFYVCVRVCVLCTFDKCVVYLGFSVSQFVRLCVPVLNEFHTKPINSNEQNYQTVCECIENHMFHPVLKAANRTIHGNNFLLCYFDYV